MKIGVLNYKFSIKNRNNFKRKNCISNNNKRYEIEDKINSALDEKIKLKNDNEILSRLNDEMKNNLKTKIAHKILNEFENEIFQENKIDFNK